MIGKYSYHCSNCGHTFISDRKDKVERERNTHRPRVKVDGMYGRVRGICTGLVRNKKTGHWMRQSLVNLTAAKILSLGEIHRSSLEPKRRSIVTP